jgi:hypothetical protein
MFSRHVSIHLKSNTLCDYTRTFEKDCRHLDPPQARRLRNSVELGSSLGRAIDPAFPISVRGVRCRHTCSAAVIV